MTGDAPTSSRAPTPPGDRPRTAADVAILGGGVTGLWTAAHIARHAAKKNSHPIPPRVVLVERSALGDGQTIASQGIIHGGIKYALTGEASAASRAIAGMPALWAACLRGEPLHKRDTSSSAALDLRAVRVLSDHQYLWSTGGFASRIAAAAASKVIRTGVRRIARDSDEWRQVIGAHNHAANTKSIDLYRVDEAVLDAASVLDALRLACQHTGVFLYSCGTGVSPVLSPANAPAAPIMPGFRWRIDCANTPMAPPTTIFARCVVLCAGVGNEELLAQAGATDVRMQRRPLHMVMAKFPSDSPPPTLFGHCLGGGLTDKPRLTVTTHTAADGRTVWYLGGLLAEEGVSRSRDEQIAAAKRETAACVPWVHLDGVEWSTLRVDRAEGLTADGKRPDQPVIRTAEPPHQTLIAAWPTKLAFAPLLASRVHELVEPFLRGEPIASSNDIPPSEHVPVAPLPWNDAKDQWVSC